MRSERAALVEPRRRAPRRTGFRSARGIAKLACMRVVKCPQCAAEVDWSTNQYRPFCSERCRVVDLGAWLDEEYTIASPFTDESADDGDPGGATTKREHDES